VDEGQRFGEIEGSIGGIFMKKNLRKRILTALLIGGLMTMGVGGQTAVASQRFDNAFVESWLISVFSFSIFSCSLAAFRKSYAHR